MADTAAWLVDRVLPDVGVRQWVLTFPWSLRFQLAREPALCRAVRRTFLRAVFGDYARRAARAGLLDARTGAVNVVQRFASALNLKRGSPRRGESEVREALPESVWPTRRYPGDAEWTSCVPARLPGLMDPRR